MQEEDAGRARNIVRGVGSLSVQNVLNAVMGFVFLASLLRYLPSQAYGAYASLQATLGIGSVVALFGFQSAVVKFLAPRSGKGNGGWGAAKAGLVLTVGFSAGVSGVLLVSAPYLSLYFMKSPSWSWVFDLGALWLVTGAISNISQSVLQGLRLYPLLAEVLLGSRLVQVSVAVAGLVLYQSLSIAIYSWALYGVLVSAAVMLFAWRPPRGANLRGYYRPVLKYAAPLGLAGLIGAVSTNADIVVVGGYLNPTSLAIYNASVVISGVLAAFFVTPLITALFAEASYSSGSPAEVSKGLALAIRFGAMVVLPASFFATATSSQLVGLFSGGGQYAQGVPFLQLITAFYIFLAVQTVAINVLQGVGRVREVLVVGAMAAMLDVAVSVSLVPMLGIAGAALGRVATMIGGCLVSLYFLRGYSRGALNIGFLTRALASASVPAVTVGILTLEVSSRVITLLPYSALGFGLFLACIRAFKLLSTEDKQIVAHLLPPRLLWVLRLL